MNYFAYGSNMDVQQMAVRCPDAVVVGTACLPGHRFLINTHGVATVVPAQGEAVHGVLWEVSKADEASLDRYEGVKSRLYRKEIVKVRQEGGNLKAALIYLAINSQHGIPRTGYMERVVVAARHSRLPKHYVAVLDSHIQRLS